MRKMHLFFTVILALGLVFTTSCMKENTADPILASSQDDAEVSALYDEVDNEATDQNNLKDAIVDTTPASGTKTITTDSINGKKVITIVYVNYVNGRNSRIKNGKITITLSGQYANQADSFVQVITLQDFTINGNLIEGTRTITKDASNPLKFHITLVGGKITFTDETTYTRTDVSRTRTWTKGYETSTIWWDDEYTIEGTASGVNRKKEAYTHTITTPLQVALNCPWIKAGAIQIVVGDGTTAKTASIDYGDGACDQTAVVTINGTPHTIKLRGGK
jgi:hypothetical protein